MSRVTGTLKTTNRINWYYEQEGNGPDIVLVPDGIGDCSLLDRPMSLLASQGFRVTTFDMPGFSRSSDAPPETYQAVTAQKLAAYVISIVDELGIGTASYWGCSSGGSTVLALVEGYSSRVRNAMVHEVPARVMPEWLLSLARKPDEEISQTVLTYLVGRFGDGKGPEGLDQEVQARLWKNYPRWVRGYPQILGSNFPVDKSKLVGKPLDWSVGADTEMFRFFDNVVTAVELGIPVRTLPGRHYTYVTHPEVMVEYIVKTIKKYI